MTQTISEHLRFSRNTRKIRIRIEKLFIAAKEDAFEDGVESQFSRELMEAIKRYGNTAIDILGELIIKEVVDPEVASEALRWIGDIKHKPTYENRLQLLQQSLNCSSAKVRDGAILGISFLDDPRAIDSIKEAMERENSKLLYNNMKQALQQLEGDI